MIGKKESLGFSINFVPFVERTQYVKIVRNNSQKVLLLKKKERKNTKVQPGKICLTTTFGFHNAEVVSVQKCF